MTVAACFDNHINYLPGLANEERPLIILDSLNGLFLGQFPRRSVMISSADVRDSFMRIHPIAFLNALDFDSCCHLKFSFGLSSSNMTDRPNVFCAESFGTPAGNAVIRSDCVPARSIGQESRSE